MATKTLKTRVQHKVDTTANWGKAVNFVPLKGEIIVYSDDKRRFKIGDGETSVANLPFSPDIASVAISGSYSDLSDAPDSLSDLTDDMGVILDVKVNGTSVVDRETDVGVASISVPTQYLSNATVSNGASGATAPNNKLTLTKINGDTSSSINYEPIYAKIQSLASNDDLDSFKTAGIWYTVSSAVINSLSHKPGNISSGECMLEVRPLGSLNYSMQIFTWKSSTNQAIWSRVQNNGAWGAWRAQPVVYGKDNTKNFAALSGNYLYTTDYSASSFAASSHNHSYSDITDPPTIPTIGTLVTASDEAREPHAGESFCDTIYLHKVSKTGSYNDLLNKPSIPSAPGTLTTTSATSLSTSEGESLAGDIQLHKVSKTGAYSDLVGTPTIPDAPGTLDTTATTAQSTSASESLSGTITLHQVAKTGNADAVNGYHMTGGGYKYKGNTQVTFRRKEKGTLTWSQLQALTTSEVNTGDIYIISDRDNKEYVAVKRTTSGTTTVTWSEVVAPYKNYTKLENNDDYIYVKIHSAETYSSNFVDFFILPSYDNTSGSTEIREYCRATNVYYADAVNYNGNKLLGIYQKSANTDYWYLKLSKHLGTYTALPFTYVGTISIYMNQNIVSAELIQPSHSEYSTVVGYNYFSIPTMGISTSSTVFQKINGVSVGTSPKFTDTTYSLSTTSNASSGKVKLHPSSGSDNIITFSGSGGTTVSSDASNNITISSTAVNNGTLSLSRNGTSIGSFTANSASNVGVDVSDIFYVTANTTVSDILNAASTNKIVCIDDGINGTYNLSAADAEHGAFFVKVVSGQVIDTIEIAPDGTRTSDTCILENQSNRTAVLSAQSTDSQYPTAKATYDAIEVVRAVAEGKTATYVVSYAGAGNANFNSQNDTITCSDYITDTNGNTVYISSLNVGDNIYVTETDVPDRWVTDVYTDTQDPTLWIAEFAKLEGGASIGAGKLVLKNSLDNNSIIDGGSFNANSASDTDVLLPIPKKTSQITNDSGFITKNVNDLTNYYTKTTSDAKYVETHPINPVYNGSGWDIYLGGDFNANHYVRIALPNSIVATATRIYFDVSISQNYTDGKCGSLCFSLMHNGSEDWGYFYGTRYGIGSDISVKASDGKYIYIGGMTPYSVISINKVMCSDTASSEDLSSLTLDTVSTIPTTHQTCTITGVASSVAWNSSTGLELKDSNSTVLSTVSKTSIADTLGPIIEPNWNNIQQVPNIVSDVAFVGSSDSLVDNYNVARIPKDLSLYDNTTSGFLTASTGVTSVNGNHGAITGIATTADLDNYISKTTSTNVNPGVTTTWDTYGTRKITVSGNSITLDMSRDTGGWTGTFASFKDAYATTNMLGFFGTGNAGLTRIYMGGTYSSPAFQIDKALVSGTLSSNPVFEYRPQFADKLQVGSLCDGFTSSSHTFTLPSSSGQLALVSQIPSVSAFVVGPASSSDGNVVVFNGTTGKSVKDSGKTLGTSVPANAVFTDTLDTAGASNKSNTKMYLIGVENQSSSYTTYSNSQCFVGTDNCLYSNGVKVITAHQSLDNYVTLSGNSQTISGDKIFTGTQQFVGEVQMKSSAATATAANNVSGFRFRSSQDVLLAHIGVNDNGGFGFYGQQLFFRPAMGSDGSVDTSYGITMDSNGMFPGSTVTSLGKSSNHWGTVYGDKYFADEIDFYKNNWNYIVGAGGANSALAIAPGNPQTVSKTTSTLAIVNDANGPRVLPAHRDNEVDIGGLSTTANSTDKYHFRNLYLQGSIKHNVTSGGSTVEVTSTLPSTDGALVNQEGLLAATTYYTNIPTTQAVGGIPKNTTYPDGISILDLIDNLLHPYVKFTFSSIATTAASGTFEYGTQKIVTKVKPTFTLGSKNISSIKIGTTSGGSDLYSGSSATSGTDITLSSSLTLDGTASATVYCTIGDGTNSEQKSVTFTFPKYYYYAVTGSTTIPSSATAIGTGSQKDITTQDNTYIWYLSPTSKSTIQQFAMNQWNDVATTYAGTTSFTTQTGRTLTYYAYRTGMLIAGSGTFRLV